jgi:hypothetical protein
VLHDTRATMYNTDFSTHFKIMRDELFRIVVTKYHLVQSEYEPDIYPAVKIRYAWNRDWNDPLLYRPGHCYCQKKCNGKGSGQGDGNCKIVTLCVFQSGKIIITGGNQFEQVQYMYQFINDILKRHYEAVYYREPFIVASTKPKTSLQKPSKNRRKHNSCKKIHESVKPTTPKPTSFACQPLSHGGKAEVNESYGTVETQTVILVPKKKAISVHTVQNIFFDNGS